MLKEGSLIGFDNLTPHVVPAVRADDMAGDHFVAFGAAGQIDRLFRVMRTARTRSGVAVFSLRNCHRKLR